MTLVAYMLCMYASVAAYVFRLSVGFNFESYLMYELTPMYIHVDDVLQITVLRIDMSSYIGPSHAYSVPVQPLLHDQSTRQSLGRIADVSTEFSKIEK